MKLYIQRITTLAAVSSFLWTTSCRSSDTENTLATGGPVTISAILDGVEFGAQTGNPQASAGKISIADNSRQSRTTMIDPSTFITVEAITNNSSVKGSAKLGTMAAIAPVIPDTNINMLPLPIGARVRIAAYLGTSTTTDRTKDYIVRANGVLEPENGPLALTHNQSYTLVIYSNGTPALPAHDNSIPYTYEDAATELQKDFMYRKYTNYVPNGGLGVNNIVVRLQHKTTQIVTNFSFVDNLTSISNAKIGTNYRNGTINLNNNNIAQEGYVAVDSNPSTDEVLLTIINPTLHTAAATPVKINGAAGAAGATTTGRFTADIVTTDINNSNLTLNRSVDAPFLIKPGYKTTLNIVQGRCGANINGVDKFFMCHNLGADYTVNPDPNDPTTDKAKLHGAKYQWGAPTETISMERDQSGNFVSFTDNGDMTGWDTSGGKNNPCPSGYRIPDRNEFSSLMTITGGDTQYNVSTFSGTWLSDNYTSFRTFTSKTNAAYSISLPATGMRDHYNISLRGIRGDYWTSTFQMELVFQGNKNSIGGVIAAGYGNAMAIRCIAN
ncbi:hypothetical protein CMU93_03540 [Elizabethkingia anophelis]|nr:hypothetical protein [Elizabethkingia anophelis]